MAYINVILVENSKDIEAVECFYLRVQQLTVVTLPTLARVLHTPQRDVGGNELADRMSIIAIKSCKVGFSLYSGEMVSPQCPINSKG